MKLTTTHYIIIGVVILAVIILFVWNPFKDKVKKTSSSTQTGSGTGSGTSTATIGIGVAETERTMQIRYKDMIYDYVLKLSPNSSVSEQQQVRSEINSMTNNQAQLLYTQITTTKQMCGGHSGIVGVWHCIKKGAKWIWGK